MTEAQKPRYAVKQIPLQDGKVRLVFKSLTPGKVPFMMEVAESEVEATLRQFEKGTKLKEQQQDEIRRKFDVPSKGES